MNDSTELPLDLEIWMPIPDFCYSISNLGRIKSHFKGKERQVKPWPTVTGYLQVNLRRDGRNHPRLVHRLVVFAFIGHCPDRCEVNHKDGNKRNNTIGNLEYMTHRDNQLHAYRILKRAAPHYGVDHKNAKFTEQDIRDIRSLLEVNTVAQIARRYSVDWKTIGNIKNGTAWKHVK